MTDPADRDEDITTPAQSSEAMDHDEIYGEDGSIRQDYLTAIGAAIADRDILFLREHVVRLHESELGDLLESISAPQRLALVQLLGDDFDFAALTEVDEAIRLEIIEALPNAKIAEALGELDSDDAVYILEDLDEADQKEILAALKDRNIAIYWAGIPITAPQRYQEQYRFLNDIYERLMKEDGVKFVNLWAPLASEDGTYSPYFETSDGNLEKIRLDDGIHFTPAGYEIMARYVYNVIVSDVKKATAKATQSQ